MQIETATTELMTITVEFFFFVLFLICALEFLIFVVNLVENHFK
jgi:hypothetical protein